ncbi:MAG: marine proteobacterial sortase target protein [Alphaproteobacteria bacterium]
MTIHIETFSYPTKKQRLAERDRWVVRVVSTVCIIAFFASALMAVTGTARAADGGLEDGLYLREMGTEDEAFVPAPRLIQSIRIDIAAIVARGSVTQVFRNESDHWVEGIYRFPLPDDAAVDQLTIRVGDRVIEGLIQERDEAAETYDAARAAGQTAALLDQERANLFSLSLANIGPGEQISVELDFQSTAAREGDAFAFTMPLVAAPRYMPDPTLAAIDHPALRAAIARQMEESERLGFPVDLSRMANATALEITLDAGGDIATLESPTHDLVVSRLREKYRIGLRPGEVPADRDMILRWSTERGSEPGAVLFHEEFDGRDYLLAMVQPPTADRATDLDRPRDVTFVVDVSGSMHGQSMEAARTALLGAIGALEPEDRFDVIVFSDRHARLFGRSQPATPSRISEASKFIAALTADGGTEMAAPLRDALSMQGTADNALRQVVFLTDGLVGNEEELLGLIESGLGDTRLFTVALGSAPNQWFMDKAAELGAGDSLRIVDLGEAEERMREFYRAIESPIVTDLNLLAAAGDRIDVYPTRLPDLYGAHSLLVPIAAERWQGPITLTGSAGGEPWALELTRDNIRPADGIARLWAMEHVDHILDQQRIGEMDSARARQAVLSVAIPHRIATRYTSFVAVDQESRRPADEQLEEAVVPNNLPAGMSVAAMTTRQAMIMGPAGAIGLPRMTWVGIGLIAGSILLLMVGRRLTARPRRTA